MCCNCATQFANTLEIKLKSDINVFSKVFRLPQYNYLDSIFIIG